MDAEEQRLPPAPTPNGADGAIPARASSTPRPRPLNLQRNPAGSEAEVAAMVRAFYARIQADAELGPIFAAHVDDWDAHLVRLTDFWSSLLRGTARFSGSPVQTHAALPDLSEALFQRWLARFDETCATLPNRVLAERAQLLAHRIARSLWLGYQLQRDPDAPPRDLSSG